MIYNKTLTYMNMSFITRAGDYIFKNPLHMQRVINTRHTNLNYSLRIKAKNITYFKPDFKKGYNKPNYFKRRFRNANRKRWKNILLFIYRWIRRI